MIIDASSTPSALSGATLASGLLGAIAAAVITLAASYIIDKRNKAWTLKAELRKHRVSRLVVANDGLRTCFFQAATLLRYHWLALGDLEADGLKPTQSEKEADDWEKRLLHEIERYNQQQGTVEAAAKAYATFLDEDLIPVQLRASLQSLLGQLTAGHTSDAASVQTRIDFFKAKEPEVMAILKQIDGLIGDEITKPL
jgi:hypothetical protein